MSTMDADEYTTSNVTATWNNDVIDLDPCPLDTDGGNTLRLLTLCDALHLYCLPVLILAGVVLNSVNFVVFRSSTLRLYAFGVYVCALAVADSLALASHMPRRWLNLLYETVGWGRGVTPYDTLDSACKSLTLLSGAAEFCSAWTTVAMASERASVAVNPYRVTRLRQAATARWIVIVVAVAAVVLNCHGIVTWRSLPAITLTSFTTTPASTVTSLSSSSGMMQRHAVVHASLDATMQCRPVTASMYLIAARFTAEAIVFPVPVLLLCVLVVVTLHGLAMTSRVDRRRRLSADLTSRLRAERHVTIMIVWMTSSHVALAVPRVATWVARAYMQLTGDTSACDQQRAQAADSVAELVFMVNYVIKYLVCIMAGRDVISSI